MLLPARATLLPAPAALPPALERFCQRPKSSCQRPQGLCQRSSGLASGHKVPGSARNGLASFSSGAASGHAASASPRNVSAAARAEVPAPATIPPVRKTLPPAALAPDASLRARRVGARAARSRITRPEQFAARETVARCVAGSGASEAELLPSSACPAASRTSTLDEWRPRSARSLRAFGRSPLRMWPRRHHDSVTSAAELSAARPLRMTPAVT
jgi:hypothetical protein